MINPDDLQNNAVSPRTLTDRDTSQDGKPGEHVQHSPCTRCGQPAPVRVGDTRRDDRTFDLNHGLCDTCRGAV